MIKETCKIIYQEETKDEELLRRKYKKLSPLATPRSNATTLKMYKNSKFKE